MSSQTRRGGGGGGGQRGGGGSAGRSSSSSNNNNPHPSRLSSRRGGGGGGGGTGGGSSSSSASAPDGTPRSRTNSSNTNHRRHRQPRNAPSTPSEGRTSSNGVDLLKDEDVLIAFMPYLKGDSAQAAKIHEDYQAGSDQKAFLKAAREFLIGEQQRALPAAAAVLEPARKTTQSAASNSPMFASAINPPAIERVAQVNPTALFPSQSATATSNSTSNAHLLDSMKGTLFAQGSNAGLNLESGGIPQSDSGLDTMRSIETGLDALLKDDPIVPLPSAPVSSSQLPVWGATIGINQDPIAINITTHPMENTPPRHSIPAPAPVSAWSGGANPIVASSSTMLSSLPAGYSLTQQHHAQRGSGESPQILRPPPQQQPVSTFFLHPTQSPSTTPLHSSLSPASNATPNSRSPMPPTPRATPNHATFRARPLDESNGTETKAQPAAAKEAPPVKRMWAHFEEQPGRVLVNGFDGSDPALVLYFGPRQELTALWSLPLDYLNQCRPGCTSLDRALDGLTVGLFRRGCVENGVQASIISKQVLSSSDVGIDKSANAVRGKVPFYSPRTPGHVLFRLYWERDPIRTLAMGPTLHIRVMEKDFDNSVRFILSNFKGKKSNPTSLSSLNTLAQVLETRVSIPNESAARALYGCIQEARKVIEACASEYLKMTSKLAVLEESIQELKKKAEEDDAKSPDVSVLSLDDADDDDQGLSEVQVSIREKMRSLMSGRASCERKWRDSQLAFASILKSAVTNHSLSILLRRDMLARMRLEYSLWCPLCEEFAVPTELAKMWYEPLRDLPQTITADDFQQYAQARAKMEVRILGFEPNTSSLVDVLFPHSRGSKNQNAMDARAVNVFNVMSTAMGQWYQELFKDEDRVVRQRDLIRERTENCVQECGAFPPGTRVVIFGSSANGFGSPKSDIDMCLQLPHELPSKDDENAGFTAMSKLAEHLEKSGMRDVDTCRLSARIPVIKFYCPNPLAVESTQEVIECDLSMHNPLAVLNTALLRTYAEITPVTRVLASIVKRWAKARDINNPARHTLSSYGYIIMLLHFMTYHKRTGNGLVTPVAPPEGDPRLRQQSGQQSPPLLPNLQWMDPMWPGFPRGTPYREATSLPRNLIRHPMEEGKTVNSYFYRPSTHNDKAMLQMLFPDQDLSLAILLAAFFRYYAFEFDYKRFVVSLHSTASRGLVEREVKAELDGWRHYSASLTVEDPFETFYDVAHVLRGGYYHRIRREFAVAYTKIADAASGRQTSNWLNKDLRSLSGQELIDWICEPVVNDRDQTQTDP